MIAFPAEVREMVARHPGSQSNLGPFLNVITWVLLITSFLAVGTRLGTKKALRRRIDVDDYLVVGALVCLFYILESSLSSSKGSERCEDSLWRKRSLIHHIDHKRWLWSRGCFSNASRWAGKRHDTAVKYADRGVPEGVCLLHRIQPYSTNFTHDAS